MEYFLIPAPNHSSGQRKSPELSEGVTHTFRKLPDPMPLCHSLYLASLLLPWTWTQSVFRIGGQHTFLPTHGTGHGGGVSGGC